MIRGKVIGETWGTKINPKLAGKKLLLVSPYKVDQEDKKVLSDEVIVAIDTVNAGRGDEVMVSFGSGARNALLPGDNYHLLVEAAISQVIDKAEGV